MPLAHERAIRLVPLEGGPIPEMYAGALEAEFGLRPSEHEVKSAVEEEVWLHPRFWWALG